MGSSAKKRKEKKKDFQKPKLKVGKTKAKAANFTDTSFKAKAVVLNQQSISANAPSVAAQFSHHLSLLSHKSDTQRRDSLAYLTSVLSNTTTNSTLPQPVSIILPEIQRLILDGSNAVRQQLLKLLQCLPQADVADHADQLLLYSRAGMTHLAPEISVFALDVLEWLLGVAGNEVVSCAGGWVKTLKCFISLLGWQSNSNGKWSTPKTPMKAGADAKVQAKQMNVLALFLRAGLIPSEGLTNIDYGANQFPLWQVEHHMLSQRSNPFAHLNLFGSIRDEETEMYEDREDRQRAFHEKTEAIVYAGIAQAQKGGGELGRAAAQLKKTMLEGMGGFRVEEVAI